MDKYDYAMNFAEHSSFNPVCNGCIRALEALDLATIQIESLQKQVDTLNTDLATTKRELMVLKLKDARRDENDRNFKETALKDKYVMEYRNVLADTISDLYDDIYEIVYNVNTMFRERGLFFRILQKPTHKDHNDAMKALKHALAMVSISWEDYQFLVQIKNTRNDLYHSMTSNKIEYLKQKCPPTNEFNRAKNILLQVLQ